VFWLTGHDACDSFRLNKLADPKEQADVALLHALHNKYRWREHGVFTANEVAKVYDEAVLENPEQFVGSCLHGFIDDLANLGLTATTTGDESLDAVLGELVTPGAPPIDEDKLKSVLKASQEMAKGLRRAGEMLTANRDKDALVDALEVKFSKRVNPMGFSAWARRRVDAYTGQYMLRSKRDATTNANYFTVEKMGE
jgi:hypothetical protein